MWRGTYRQFHFQTEGEQAIETSHRINEQIRITPVRVVNQSNDMVGVIPTVDALRMAYDAGLDLVEVAPTERPPVCRILDYGKFKYEQKKKSAKNTKTHQVQIKEIRLRPKIGEHDIDFKVKHAREFLAEKDKVKLTIQFRGRENAHHDLGREVLKSMIEKLADVAKVESPPRMEGRSIMAVLTPK
ncbi:translation initiation factor IF-3 [Planctomyces sp. SH-PL14]|uniref:translation initiation factor IF-3 n=1 Tax=Planctomyces sp. SH-PL14 TaxID=1632864 RepID=UPI00078D812A|nr:translation initiation factor IF-3 [Planctomyces sp. SH-PL14]AMV20309.1 Translation initiation factor IF-3 [Planctomyces sp. SH-PL14]